MMKKNKKQETKKTSSFIVDLEKSTFENFNENYSIYEYTLPDFVFNGTSVYAKIQNWAKSELKTPYHFNSGLKKIFVLVKANEEAPLLTIEEAELKPKLFEDYKKVDKVFIWLRVLATEFLWDKEKFIGNDDFYIITEIQKETWAKVIKLKINHDYNDENEIVFNVKADATSLYQPTKYDKMFNKIAYGLIHKGKTTYLKQLSKNDIKDEKNIFIKRSGNKSFRNKKTEIKFHSIKSVQNLLKTKEYIVNTFITELIDYFKEQDISINFKYRQFEKINVGKFNSKKGKLDFSNFKIILVDERVNKSVLLENIIENPFPNLVQFEINNWENISAKDNVIIVMDYDNEFYTKFFNDKEDPYIVTKQKAFDKGVVSQGFNVNTKSKKEGEKSNKDEYFEFKQTDKSKKDLKRNLEISTQQLMLKRLIKDQSTNIPKVELIENKVFLCDNKMLFIKDNKLTITEADDLEYLVSTIESVTGRKNVNDEMLEICSQQKYKKGGTDDYFSDKNRAFIFSKENILEIEKYNEILLYDDKEILKRIKELEKQRPISKFKVKPTTEIAKKYNLFIDEHVTESFISYKDLLKKYGKNKETGFLKKIIYEGKEQKTYADTPYRKLLKEHGSLDLKGVKEDKILQNYSGIWYNEQENKYYVGRLNSYESDQNSSYQMRKIKSHFGTFNKEEYFPLLNVDFIRHKELTVIPYPFRLINIHTDMNKNPKTKNNTNN